MGEAGEPGAGRNRPDRSHVESTLDRGPIEDLGRWREFSAGMWAWLLHKFSGWILVGYLFMHIPVLSTALDGPDAYDATIQGLEGMLLTRVMEVALLSVAVFHILNGVRLLLIDLGIGLDAQETSYYVALVVTGLVTVASVPTFVAGVSY